MPTPAEDNRSPRRREMDERIASQPAKNPLDMAAGTQPTPVEAHLARMPRRPMAVAGVVENGLVRPLDSSVKLPEHARVIIVASGE